jgi:hypothetical protein
MSFFRRGNSREVFSEWWKGKAHPVNRIKFAVNFLSTWRLKTAIMKPKETVHCQTGNQCAYMEGPRSAIVSVVQPSSSGNIYIYIYIYKRYFQLKMVVRPKHVAVN